MFQQFDKLDENVVKNTKIREVIDAITSKMVLILGRFTPQRKRVLEAIRQELRRANYLPVLFDFDKPVSRDLTETISTLAYMARFVIVDLTEAKSVPQELQSIVPNLPSVPIQPIYVGVPQTLEELRGKTWQSVPGKDRGSRDLLIIPISLLSGRCDKALFLWLLRNSFWNWFWFWFWFRRLAT